jgi:hypothetical protein
VKRKDMWIALKKRGDKRPRKIFGILKKEERLGLLVMV